MVERRVDPEDGVAYTWDEMCAQYLSQYTVDDMTAYWELCEKLVQRRGPQRAVPHERMRQQRAPPGGYQQNMSFQTIGQSDKAKAPTLETIVASIAALQPPDKDQLWNTVQKLAQAQRRALSPFKFVPRGSLSSPYVQHVSDIDVIFTSKGNSRHAFIEAANFDNLLCCAQKLFEGGLVYSMQMLGPGEDPVFDRMLTPHEKADEIFSQSSHQGICLVTLTGAFRWTARTGGGLWIPMDLSLQLGENRMTQEERKQKMTINLEDGNFAKAVQRLRSGLKDGRKAAVASAWNESGGKARFLVKQLSMLDALLKFETLPEFQVVEYCRRVLKVPLGSCAELPLWMEVAETAMQSQGRKVLTEHSEAATAFLGRSVLPYLRGK